MGSRPGSPGLIGDVLRGADHALDDRVDLLEVARVRREDHRHLDRHPVLTPQQPGAEVVFDVAREILGRIVDVGWIAADRLRLLLAFEGLDDRGVGLAEDMGQHVQATAVGHADHDFARAGGGGGVDALVDHRHDHVVAFDREALLAEIGLMQEALEALDLGQAAKERAAGGRLQRCLKLPDSTASCSQRRSAAT